MDFFENFLFIQSRILQFEKSPLFLSGDPSKSEFFVEKKISGNAFFGVDINDVNDVDVDVDDDDCNSS